MPSAVHYSQQAAIPVIHHLPSRKQDHWGTSYPGNDEDVSNAEEQI